MSRDTRASILGFTLAPLVAPPLPDGSVDALDRQHLLAYRGIAVQYTGDYTLAAGTNTITVTAPSAQVSAQVTLAAGTQTIDVTAPTASVVAGAVTLSAGANTIDVTAPTASIATGAAPQTLDAGANTVTVTAPSAQVSAQVTLSAGENTVDVTAPGAQVSAQVTLAAGTNTVEVTAPTATLLNGVATLAAGANTITVTAPTATVLAGPVTLAAGTQTIDVTAPTATLQQTVPGTDLAAGANTITITAPTATLVATATLSAGVQTITVTAPAATITGGLPVDTAYNLIEAIIRRAEDTSAISSLLTGGAWHGRAPRSCERPYAVLEVSYAENHRNSGIMYWTVPTVSVTFYDNRLATLERLGFAWQQAFNHRMEPLNFTNGNHGVCHSGPLRMAGQRRAALTKDGKPLYSAKLTMKCITEHFLPGD